MAKKRTIEEFGVMLTTEMCTLFHDDSITDEQVGRILRGILWNSTFKETKKDASGVVGIMVRTLLPGYEKVNSQRVSSIIKTRDSKRAYQRRVREEAEAAHKLLVSGIPRESTRIHANSIDSSKPSIPTINSNNIIYNNNPNPKGNGKQPHQITPEEVMGQDAISAVVERLHETHPRKGGVLLAERYLRSLVKKNAATPEEAAALLDGIESNHESWLKSAAWRKDDGEFVPKLSKWIRDGSCLTEPDEIPEKKSAPDSAGVKVDCSQEVC